MASFDVPNISVGKKSNEENMQETKSYLYELSEQLNYYVSNLEERVSYLEQIVSNSSESES